MIVLVLVIVRVLARDHDREPFRVNRETGLLDQPGGEREGERERVRERKQYEYDQEYEGWIGTRFG